MLQISDIQQAVQRVAMRHGLEKVTLFGSYARGEADESSDVDLVVETSSPLGFERGAICNELEQELRCPVDVIFGESNLYPFVREAYRREGMVLHGIEGADTEVRAKQIGCTAPKI